MNHRIFFCFIALIGFVINAQNVDINLRGRVTSGGNAVADAIVTLMGQNLKDTTDNNGNYSIKKTTVAVLRSIVPQAEKITFSKGVLELSLLKSSPLKTEVFDVKGKLLKREVRQNAPAGVYRMNIAELSSVSNVLIITASIGERTMTCRYLPLQNGNYLLKTSDENIVSPSSGKLAKLAAVVDSIKVEKAGFKTKVVAVELYDATVNISLEPSGSVSDFVEDEGYDCTVGTPNGSNGGSSTVLPDPFTMWNGTQVKTMGDWRCRRRELVVEIEKRILGEKAPPPAKIGGSVTGSITNTSYKVDVTTPKGSTSFSGTVSLPKTGSAPYPAVIVVGGFNSLNSDVLSSEGVATISYDAYSIASEASNNYSTGKYYDANPDYKGKTGALVAWAWGVSRIIDMLEKNPNVIDPKKIAIHGCSRFGKAAFVIGAFDQRIALGLPLEPGTGGPAPLRALPTLGGQSLSGCNGEASWFGPTSKDYSSNMAVDMSDVAAMYAPRGLLLMDNPHIDHLSYKANYLGCAAAYEVYKAMGRQDALWYLGSSGNGSHCSTRAEYGSALRAMIQKFLKGNNSATTGGLNTHSKHGNVNVAGWTSSWKKGNISQ